VSLLLLLILGFDALLGKKPGLLLTEAGLDASAAYHGEASRSAALTPRRSPACRQF